eukprot:CAMPEP_0197684634 /NCGR_PEP_ID=MMETSP1338-20131121/99748_1 /TAXON_ID=43686 ORGANISM="Pelagodinium beii, Strain RCC1491" /NCGR_SAMPLE_ID=MMETSP1338 /ASSEMBLY_ACC=CAM_ASM_000754 /LENGTH=190 /DNA_ID=CAMNT_0043266369 /DNA_START=198 /DNA_END=770 /DNA_ORIENTATION=-
MGDIWWPMEEPTDAMPTESSHHAAASFARLCFNQSSQLPVHGARADDGSGCLERVVSSCDKVGGLLIALTNEKRLVEIGVEAVVTDADIQINDISVLDHSAVRNSVAYDLICRHADRLREAKVIQWAGVKTPLLTSEVHNSINLIPCDPRLQESRGQVENFSSQSTGLSHGREIFPLKNGDRLRPAAHEL